MKWNPEDVSEGSSALYDKGMLVVKVTGQRDGETKNGLARIEVQSRILSPDKLKGQSYDFNFCVGISASYAATLGLEEDLAAENPSTWAASIGAKQYKRFLKKAGVPFVGDTEEEADGVKGKVIGIFNDNDGTYNDAKAFYTEAEAEAQVSRPRPTANRTAPSPAPVAQAAQPATTETWDA